jgi:hypothetical protein
MRNKGMSGEKGKRIVLHGLVPGAGPLHPSGETRVAGERAYLLSPAHAGGKRAAMLFNTNAKFELAQRLRATGVPIGEMYSFMSPLYFRGKLTYATKFAKALSGSPAVLVITPSRGLMRPESVVKLDDVSGQQNEQLVAENPRYRDALERDLRTLSGAIGRSAHVVLLGSIATRKYIPLLAEILGDRLVVPRKFIGLGNMSRGALLLQCSRDGCELEYISASQALAEAI